MKKISFSIICFYLTSIVLGSSKVKKYDCGIYHTLDVCQTSKYCSWNCETNSCMSTKKYVGKITHKTFNIKCPKTTTSISTYTKFTPTQTSISNTLTPTSTSTKHISNSTSATYIHSNTTTITTTNPTTPNTTHTITTNTNSSKTTISTNSFLLTSTAVSTFENTTEITHPVLIISNFTSSNFHNTNSKIEIILPISILTFIILVLVYKLYHQKNKSSIINNQPLEPVFEREEPILHNSAYQTTNSNTRSNSNLKHGPEYLEPQSYHNNLLITESNLSIPIYSEIFDSEYSHAIENNTNYDMVI